jgi:hypothetical protein
MQLEAIESKKSIENKKSQRKSAQLRLDHKFLTFIANSGLKAHQSPCDWASGSLNSASRY